MTAAQCLMLGSGPQLLPAPFHVPTIEVRWLLNKGVARVSRVVSGGCWGQEGPMLPRPCESECRPPNSHQDETTTPTLRNLKQDGSLTNYAPALAALCPMVTAAHVERQGQGQSHGTRCQRNLEATATGRGPLNVRARDSSG